MSQYVYDFFHYLAIFSTPFMIIWILALRHEVNGLKKEIKNFNTSQVSGGSSSAAAD